MPRTYSLPRKIEALLKDEHGITASVSEVANGIMIRSGTFDESIQGVITKDKIAALAQRIKDAG